MINAVSPGFRWLQAIEVHAGRILIHWVRSPAMVAYTLGIPIAMVAIIRLMFSGMVEQFSGKPMNMVEVSVMVAVSQAFTGGLFGAGAIVQERQDGLPQRLATLPGPRSAVVAGRILAESIRAFASIMTAILVGVVYGANFNGMLNVIEITLYLVIVALSAGAFGSMLGYLVDTPQGAFSVTPLIMAFTIFNTAMMPRDMYLPSLRRLVDVSPITAITRLVELTISGGADNLSVITFLSWFVGLMVFSLLILGHRVNASRR